MTGAAALPLLALTTLATTGAQVYMADEAKDQANKVAGEQKLAQQQAEEKLKEDEARSQTEFIMKAQRAHKEGERRPAYMNMFARPEIGYVKNKKMLVGS